MINVDYVTSSAFKREENEVFAESCSLSDGVKVEDAFSFRIRHVEIRELLEIDITTMVKEEVVYAYRQLRIPCVVEHAGLIFDDYAEYGYPGGLTKPMWNSLGDRFISETQSAGRKATARAVVAYCDGQKVRTFSGETSGFIADAPRGDRAFYWDTVFVPDVAGKRGERTYAEIVEKDGLSAKILLSQSTKAMMNFLEFRRLSRPELWE